MKSKIMSLLSVALLFSSAFIFKSNNYVNANNNPVLNDSITSSNDSIQIGDSLKVKVRKSSSYVSNYFGNRQSQNNTLRSSQTLTISNSVAEIDSAKIIKADSTSNSNN